MTRHMHIRKRILLLLISLISTASFGKEVAKGFNCPANTPPEKIITAFVAAGILEKSAFDSTDMVPTYGARPGFTAFTYPLVAVSGWSPDSKFFGRGPGTSPPTNIALIVQANAWQVKDALRSQNVDFKSGMPSENFPYIFVEPYGAEYTEPLPKGVNGSAAYTRVTCRPRL